MFAPRSASASAMARPIPRPDPVINATFPSKFLCMVSRRVYTVENMNRLFLLILALTFMASAQEPPVRDQRRGGRGSTREFLGLGAAPDPAAADRGEKVFAPNCAICHGP